MWRCTRPCAPAVSARRMWAGLCTIWPCTALVSKKMCIRPTGSAFLRQNTLPCCRPGQCAASSGVTPWTGCRRFFGDGRDFDIGVDYTECGLMKYFAAQGMPELAPYPCRVDFPTARAEGTGLVRSTTLASGGKVCDFRYKQGRSVTQWTGFVGATKNAAGAPAPAALHFSGSALFDCQHVFFNQLAHGFGTAKTSLPTISASSSSVVLPSA